MRRVETCEMPKIAKNSPNFAENLEKNDQKFQTFLERPLSGRLTPKKHLLDRTAFLGVKKDRMVSVKNNQNR